MYTNDEVNNFFAVESSFDGIFDGDSDCSPIDDPVEIHHDVDLDDYCIPENLFAELRTTDFCDCELSSCETLSDSNSLLYLVANGMRMKSSAVRKKRENPPKKMTALPADFQPTPYSIICGRGKESYNYIGNCRFRATVCMFVNEYIAAKDSQYKKSEIVEKVLDILYRRCPPGGAFVKYQDGRYWSVDHRTAREKVGSLFRDCLADHYSSSSKSKISKRKQRRKDKQEETKAEPTSPMPG